MLVFSNVNYDFTIPEISEEERDILPKMLYAQYQTRADKRKIEREYQTCESRLLAIEENFLHELGLIEDADFSYNDLYKHWLDHWQEQTNFLKGRLKLIQINTHYFTCMYKPIEKC